jgi:hypothetical protein
MAMTTAFYGALCLLSAATANSGGTTTISMNHEGLACLDMAISMPRLQTLTGRAKSTKRLITDQLSLNFLSVNHDRSIGW